MNACLLVPNTGAKVTLMVPHPSLPLVALVYASLNLVKVCKLDEFSHPSTDEPSFGLQGNYQTHKTSKPIIDLKWVGDMDQMLILMEPDFQSNKSQIELVASESTLKIIALLGNKASLQEEVNRKLGQSPQIMKLTKYSKIASYDKVLG